MVMDTFTDVDIFSDLLDAAARHVPVYILLDERESCHFVSMVINCKVNLDLIPVSLLYCLLTIEKHVGTYYYYNLFNNQFNARFQHLQMMRVRTVPGITYQSKTGKSFKGQVKDRYLLADCRAVLSGNYR